MNICAVWNYIAYVYADAEPDRPIGGLTKIVGGNLVLHLHGTAYGSINAIENHKQRIAPRINNSATIFSNRRVYQHAAENAQPFECSGIVQPNQAAVTNHIGMDDSDQLPSP